MNLRKIPFRLILSVAAGIATATVLSLFTHELLHLAGIFPAIKEPMFDTQILVIDLFYHSVYAVLGAVVTAHLAREKALKAAFILGSKEAIMWVLGTILLWKHAAPWYNLSKAALGIPLALLGGHLYVWYKNRKTGQKNTFFSRPKAGHVAG